MKHIIINQGDEYRAKIEKDFSREDYFFDSYQRAAKCVTEIVNEAVKYLDSYDRGNNNGHAFYDYGNNILAFCAERGQGKTSAMLSFSGELERFGKEKTNNTLGFGFEKDKCYFEVLESIDPTMINDGVAVLKVFLSRLFYRIQAWVDNNQTRIGRSVELTNNYNNVLVLFKKCYTNIEYLQKDMNKDWDVDDLDTLFQIGDSSNLKNNIYDLIRLYFEVTRGKKQENRFLVVQIDDADLATGSASDICEYVRKFLKIPGVIVLMATDHEQLLHAFNHKYDVEYSHLIRNDSSFSETCRKMAAKYLEKILPHSHRIELPKIQDVLVEEHAELLLQYKVDGVCQFDSEFKECKDIQEQLIKLIYLRTGIILLRCQEKMHLFLPCRLRELTHLIKLLWDMEQVDHNLIYELGETDLKRQELVGRLQRNIRMFKAYFMNDWCVNRLEQSEQKLIFKINEALNTSGDTQVYKVLSDYLNKHGKNHVIIPEKLRTHKYILRNLVDGGLSDKSELQSAIYLYYTIYLNNKFADALNDETQYKQIMEWLENPIEIPHSLRSKKYVNKYQFAHFTFNFEDVIKQFTDVGSGLKRVWLEMFCRAEFSQGEEITKLFVSVWENSKERIGFNTELKSAEFDVLQPLNTVFSSTIWQKWKKEDQRGELLPDDSLMDIEPGLEEKNLKINTELVAVYRCVKNIIANYDVQMHLLNFLERTYQHVNLREKVMPWKASCLEIYSSLDSEYNTAFGYLGADCKLHPLFEKVFDQPKTYGLVFLSNEDNKIAYWNDYKNKLDKVINSISDSVSFFGGMKEEKTTEDLMMQIEFFKHKLEDLKESNILGRREDIASVNNKVKELWIIEEKIIDIHKSILGNIEENIDDVEKLPVIMLDYSKSLETLSDELKKNVI